MGLVYCHLIPISHRFPFVYLARAARSMVVAPSRARIAAHSCAFYYYYYFFYFFIFLFICLFYLSIYLIIYNFINPPSLPLSLPPFLPPTSISQFGTPGIFCPSQEETEGEDSRMLGGK